MYGHRAIPVRGALLATAGCPLPGSCSPSRCRRLPAGLTPCPSSRSPAGFGAALGCCSAGHPACLLPGQVVAVMGEFLAGLSEAFVWAVVQGFFFFFFFTLNASGGVSGLGFLQQDAASCWGASRQLSPACSWVMGSLAGSSALAARPEALQA